MHPLIKALIDTLPAPGTPWSSSARAAWLKMMGTAFEMAYTTASGEPPKAKRGRPAIKIKAIEPPFYIDKDGFARQRGGERINKPDVSGPIVDLRGESGDIGAIVWADDTRGTKGVQLDITIG